MNQIVIFDQIAARRPERSVVMDWAEGIPLTVRLLIEERIRQKFRPTADAGATADARAITWLDGPITHDIDTAIGQALKGFEAQRFILVVGGQQVSSLDDVIALTPSTSVTFVRLLPLKGG